jgi:hypothetical protein
MRHEGGLDGLGKKKKENLFLFSEFELRIIGLKPSRYTDCAVLAAYRSQNNCYNLLIVFIFIPLDEILHLRCLKDQLLCIAAVSCVATRDQATVVFDP